MNKQKQKFWKRELVRITEYMVTGGAWFWSGYSIFFVCDKLLHWSFFPAKLTATFVGLTINFILERYWVFAGKGAKKPINEVTGRYIVITIINIGLDTAIVYGLKRVGISPYLGQFASAGFFTVWNYLWYRLWVFSGIKKKPSPRASAPMLHRSKHARSATKLTPKRA